MQPILQFLSARTVLAFKDLNHQLHMYIKHHIPIWMRLFLVIGSMLQNPKKNLWWTKFWTTWIICKTWWIRCSQTCRSWLVPPCTFHPLRHLWTWATLLQQGYKDKIMFKMFPYIKYKDRCVSRKYIINPVFSFVAFNLTEWNRMNMVQLGLLN